MEDIFGEPVTTSVTGKPQRASEVPGDLTVITQDDICQTRADNIPDILQFVTGIDGRQYSFGVTEVGVRGYDTTAEQFNLARQIESAGDYVGRRFFASATVGF